LSFLNKLFGRTAVAEAPEEERECVHISLSAGWDKADDMGVEAKASHFTCGSCAAVFTPAEAAHLRATEAERIAAH
jgi:hypothetical protein